MNFRVFGVGAKSSFFLSSSSSSCVPVIFERRQPDAAPKVNFVCATPLVILSTDAVDPGASFVLDSNAPSKAVTMKKEEDTFKE